MNHIPLQTMPAEDAIPSEPPTALPEHPVADATSAADAADQQPTEASGQEKPAYTKVIEI